HVEGTRGASGDDDGCRIRGLAVDLGKPFDEPGDQRSGTLREAVRVQVRAPAASRLVSGSAQLVQRQQLWIRMAPSQVDDLRPRVELDQRQAANRRYRILRAAG